MFFSLPRALLTFVIGLNQPAGNVQKFGAKEREILLPCR
jgi:hypothetical protein